MLVHCSTSSCLRSCAAARSGTTMSGKARDRSAGKPPPIFRAARGGALSGRLGVGARFGGDSAATSAFTICSTSNCEAAAASGAKPIVWCSALSFRFRICCRGVEETDEVWQRRRRRSNFLLTYLLTCLQTSVSFISVEPAPVLELLPEQHGLLLFQPV